MGCLIYGTCDKSALYTILGLNSRRWWEDTPDFALLHSSLGVERGNLVERAAFIDEQHKCWKLRAIAI